MFYAAVLCVSWGSTDVCAAVFISCSLAAVDWVSATKQLNWFVRVSNCSKAIRAILFYSPFLFPSHDSHMPFTFSLHGSHMPFTFPSLGRGHLGVTILLTARVTCVHWHSGVTILLAAGVTCVHWHSGVTIHLAAEVTYVHWHSGVTLLLAEWKWLWIVRLECIRRGSGCGMCGWSAVVGGSGCRMCGWCA